MRNLLFQVIADAKAIFGFYAGAVISDEVLNVAHYIFKKIKKKKITLVREKRL